MGKKIIFSIMIVVMVVSMFGCKKHEHVFADATCDKPRTCEGCGKEEGEALGHIMKEADCDNPAQCKRCDYKEGEALGHTAAIGICENCNEFQGDALMDDLSDKFGEGMDLITEACTVYMEYAYSAANRAVSLTNTNLKKAEKSLMDIVEICKKDANLKSMIPYINDIIKEYPTVDKVTNDTEWKAYYECIKAVSQKALAFSIKYWEVLNEVYPMD